MTKENLKKSYGNFDSASLPNFLDPHQRQGVRWILTRRRSYLAHAPGAGKTCQAIVASLLLKDKGQTLFIVPPGLETNWEKEILMWTAWRNMWPSIEIVPQSKDKVKVDWRADYIIVPDSMLTKLWVMKGILSRKFKLMAIDEASRFKEPTAQRTAALFGGQTKAFKSKGLQRVIKTSVLMDGSPMPNRPMELWVPTVAMAPETIAPYTSHHDYGVKFCGGRFLAEGHVLDWDYRGSSNEDKLKRRLQNSFMHVVTEDKLNHPERRRSLLFMKDNRSARVKTWEKKHLKTLNLNELDEEMSRGDIARLRREIGMSKIDWVSKYVGARLENKQESILLFAWHRDVCEGLAKSLRSFRPSVVVGATERGERERAFRAFNEKRCRLIIGNIAAMGRGHNLQRADRVVFAEYSWTDENNKQCEKRASRKGSTKEFVRCDYIVVPNSLDEIVLNSVFTKERRIKKVIG